MTTTPGPAFTPFKLGAIEVANRFAMAPMTRARAPSRVPNDIMRQYYAQRAGAGLIISEATQVSVQGTLENMQRVVGRYEGSHSVYVDEVEGK